MKPVTESEWEAAQNEIEIMVSACAGKEDEIESLKKRNEELETDLGLANAAHRHLTLIHEAEIEQALRKNENQATLITQLAEALQDEAWPAKNHPLVKRAREETK